jgi:DNA primase small subunit
MLELVKDELIKLTNFLMEDFGFNAENMHLYFSGGRGYHCHVCHPKVIQLGSQERREIIDYITGRGLEINRIFKERVMDGGRFPKTRLEMPPPDTPGWKGRISRTIIAFVEKIHTMNQDDAIEYLTQFDGIGQQIAHDFVVDLSAERTARIKEGILDQSPAIRKIFLREAIRSSAMQPGEPDEPVTSDIKRLIRLPGSLHGKTGLKVAKVSIDEIKDFNPLDDAVAFEDNPIKIVIKKPFEIRMNGEHFRLNEGMEEVPEYLAVFLIAQKIAIPQ